MMIHTHRGKGKSALALVLLGCASLAAWGQPGTGPSGSGQPEGQMPGQTRLEDLVARSSWIVWGPVSRIESYWQTNERGHHIFTRVTIEPVLRSVKGQLAEPLVFEIIGGTVGEVAESVSNVPGFAPGETVILFLTGDPYRLVGGRHGKINVYDGHVYWGGLELAAETFLEMLDLMAAGQSPLPLWQQEVQRHELSAFAAPYITSITPGTASAGTGTQVTITGTNFGSSGTVEFFHDDGTSDVQASIISWSDDQIVCTVPVVIVGEAVRSASSGPVKVKTSGGTSNGYPFYVTFGYGQMKWPGENPTVSYYINENTSDCTGEGSAVQRAASTWNAAGARFHFTYGGTSSLTAPDLDNGQNDVMWGATDALAVTYTSYIGATGTILECDLVFDDDFVWSTAGTPPGGTYDVEQVGLHELGHFLQLADLYGADDDDKVMYGVYTLGSDGKPIRSLRSADSAGIQWIYPSGTPPPPPPTYQDIGLRVYDGKQVVRIACEPSGTLTSPLRIAKNGVVYGIVLVSTSDPSASAIRITTGSGSKALRKY